MHVLTNNTTQMENAATEDNKKRLNLPDIFYGDRPKLEKWLFQLDLYIKIKEEDMNDTDKIEFAMTLMRGRTEDWIMAKYRTYEEQGEESDLGPFFANYKVFKKEMRRIFGISNDKKIAEKMVQNIKQKKSAAEYTSEFLRYSDRLECGDDALMDMYKAGLKENYKDQLTFWGGKIDDLEELTAEAIKVDDKLYKRSLEKRRQIPTTAVGRTHGGTYKPFGKPYYPPNRWELAKTDPHPPP